MNLTFIREPNKADEIEFITLMKGSKFFHQPWVAPPTDSDSFNHYLEKISGDTKKGFLVCLKDSEKIAGVVNLNEITRGALQSAYLGYWVVSQYAGKGYMKDGLRLVINYAYYELGLHRLEANIQPENRNSIGLVKSLGFKKEGFSPKYLLINGEWKDHERWAILVEDWNIAGTVT